MSQSNPIKKEIITDNTSHTSNNDNANKETDELFYPILAESSSGLNERNQLTQKFIKLNFKLRNSWSFMDFSVYARSQTHIMTLKSIIIKRHECNVCNIRLYKKTMKGKFEMVLCDDNHNEIMMRTIHDVFLNDDNNTTEAPTNDYNNPERKEIVIYYDFKIKDYKDPDPLLLI